MDLKYKAHVYDPKNKTAILWLEDVEKFQLDNLFTIVDKEEKEKQINSSSKEMMSELGM